MEGGFVQTTAERSSPWDETSEADVGQRGAAVTQRRVTPGAGRETGNQGDR